MVKINRSKCIGCLECVRECPNSSITRGDDGFPQTGASCIGCQHCLAVCPEGAVSVDVVSANDVKAANGPIPSPDEMENLIRQRRSIRRYHDENVPKETMDRLLDALRYSPTGCNDHRLFFSVVDDKSKMQFFRDCTNGIVRILLRTGILQLLRPSLVGFFADLDSDPVFRHAPHMIVACTPRNAPCAKVDPIIALSEFELLANSLGVGTLWCGFAKHAFAISRKMRKALGMPAGYKVGYVMLFGLPAVSYARTTQPSAALVGKTALGIRETGNSKTFPLRETQHEDNDHVG
ncbi:MAG: nitroreductase family protein [Victivallaceae bacterium]|nr:nitroreductase family protein [Victivallaceae bacterium]